MPLKVSDGMGAWIDDFKKSDAPQFKGKSDKERRDQAIAAYLSAKRGDKQEGYMPNYADKMKKKMMTPSDKDKLLKIKQMLDKEKNQKQENVKSADKKPEVYTKSDGKKGVRMVPTDKEVVKTEGYVSMAQQRAVWATRKDSGKGHPDNKNKSKKEDASSAAVKAYMAKGGKVTKLPPGKAAGYHGKDDPGKDMHGVMDRGDTKQLPRKKVKSMEAKTRIMGESMRKVAAVQGQMSKINDRLRKNPKHPGAGKDRTDLLDLQRKMVALRKSRNESVDELAMYTSKKLPNLSYPKKKTKYDKEKDRINMMKKNRQKGESVNEISDKLKMKYRDKAKDTMRLKRAQLKSISKSAYAGATDKEKERASKRADSIMTSIRLRSRPKGESVKEEMNFAVSIEGLPQMFISADSPGMLKQTLRKIVKQPSMIQNVKRVTDAQVKKTFRLKAQGRDEESEE